MGYQGTYCIADKVFAISSLYQDIHILAKNYKVKGKPSFVVSVKPEDIALEKAHAQEVNEYHGEPDSYLETLVVLRKLMDVLVKEGYILFHGSLISIYNRGYLFTAKSGVGKSTHTKLYKKWLGKKVTVVNGDKPILKITDDGVIAYGTPWSGKEGWNTNTKVKLEAICHLNRGEENEIHPISIEEAFPVLFSQTHRDPNHIAETLGLVSKLSSKVRLYHLSCNRNADAPKVSYEGMNPNRSFEDILLLEGTLVYTARGVSMLPLIVEKKDLLTITRNDKPIQQNDVVLFKRDTGAYVLHRCIKVNKDSYSMCGDNQHHVEKGVLDRHILGVLTAITRDGVTLHMDDPKYLDYVKNLTKHFFWRCVKLKLKELPGRIKRKLTRI